MKRFGKALVFGILCLILTFAITVQLRVSSLSESESSQTKITDKLKDEIFRLNDENVKLAEKFQNTTSELDDARNQAAQNDSSSKDTSELIKKYTNENMKKKPNTSFNNSNPYMNPFSMKYNPIRNQYMSNSGLLSPVSQHLKAN